MPTKNWTQAWHQQQVNAYNEQRPAYVLYARLLGLVMTRACETHTSEGHAAARPKDLASFAEKAIRKYDKYPDPIHQFTDLCGARAVLLTQDDADQIAQFVRDNFLIDTENSEDVRTRLKPDQFGYRAIHYIVQMPWMCLLGHKPFKQVLERLSRQFRLDMRRFLEQVGDPNGSKVLERVLREGANSEAALFGSLKAVMDAEAVEILREAIQQLIQEGKPVNGGYKDPLQIICAIGNRKAEIQIQTLLQHGWAAISHDRLYKTNFQPPSDLERQLTRVAALLEEGDEQFCRCIGALEEYQLDYGKYLAPEQIEAEISKWQTVAKCEPGNLKVALTIAEYAKALEDWDEIIERLTGFATSQDHRVLRLLGLAHGKRDRHGRESLATAVNSAPEDPASLCLLAETYCNRSDCFERNGSRTRRTGCHKALSLFAKAFGEVAPGEPSSERIPIKDPHAFRRYAECLICSGRCRDLCALAAPALKAAWEIAYRRSDVHVRAMESLYDMGFFALLLNWPYDSLGAYARAVFLSPTESAIEAELHALERLAKAAKGRNPLPWTKALPWVVRFLQLARVAKLQQVARRAPTRLEQKQRDLAARKQEVQERETELQQRNLELQEINQAATGFGQPKGRRSEDAPLDDPAIAEGLLRDRNLQDAQLKSQVAAGALEEAKRAVSREKQALREAKEQSAAVTAKANSALAKFRKLDPPKRTAKGRRLPFGRIEAPIVVMVGGCDPSSEPQMQSYARILVEAFDGFSGIVCSAGTRAGIGSIAGDIQEHYGKAIITLGYLPNLRAGKVQNWVLKDERYWDHVPTKGEDFSPLEPLQYWSDMIASGIAPYDVRILGINGGKIAALEYRLALALDASVAVLEKSGREAARLLQNEDWGVAERLMVLPAEVPVIRAYVRARSIKPPRGFNVTDDMARQIHADYRRLRIKQAKLDDSSLNDWDQLPLGVKEGNFEQARHWADHLQQIGYVVRKQRKGPASVAQLEPGEIDDLGQMEHARYLVERFLKGWKYGDKKDNEKKTNPTLVGWSALPPREKEKDRDAARGALKLFAKHGFVVSQKPAPQQPVAGLVVATNP